MSSYVIHVLSYKDISNIFYNNGEHKLTGNPRLTHPVGCFIYALEIFIFFLLFFFSRCTSGKELSGNIWEGLAPSKKQNKKNPWRVIRGTFYLSPSKGAYQISFLPLECVVNSARLLISTSGSAGRPPWRATMSRCV